MKIIITKDYQNMSQKAANIIAAQLIIKSDSVLGLATGSTMLGLYDELVERYIRGDIDFLGVKTINLDEYLGLHPSNSQSYSYYMHKNFFDRINILPDNVHIPDGMTDDTSKECERYDSVIEALECIDLQLLGLGVDGHIGFNEPEDFFPINSHCISLDESTIKANSRFFEHEDDVPKRALTMGIGTIMKAKKILLCANGKAKAPILDKVLFGPITPRIPGSILQLHPDITVVADEEAMSLSIERTMSEAVNP